MNQLLKIHTVSEVTTDIKNIVEDNFSSIWVSGQISNFKPAQSGHFYFTLKDDKAQMSAVMFRGANYKVKFKPEDGLEVVLHGRLSVYEPRGQYQIIVDTMEPKGLGALQLAFDQLKKKLSDEGLFDDAHKKPLPYLPKRIGIITSSQGAAVHDMVTVLTRRFPNIEILINPVRVQGEGAAEEIAEAIAEFNATQAVDVIIVGRGGGSMEDLWAFNEEVLVRTVYASDIPIISAVGHETDYTLCDLVADLRAPTPSAAAELVVPRKEDLEETICQHAAHLGLSIQQMLVAYADRLRFLKKQVKDPRRVIDDFRLRVDDDYWKLELGMKRLFQEKRHALSNMILKIPDPRQKMRELQIQIKGLKNHLQALSPLAPLNRGYGIVFDVQGKSVRSIEQVEMDETLQIRLADGTVTSRVMETKKLSSSSH